MTAMALLLLIGGRADAQVVRGRITDSETSEPLIGVVVYTSPTSGTQSDADGRYELRLEAGQEVKLIFSYIGYLDGNSDVLTLKEGEERVIDIRMVPDIFFLESAVVTARKDGESTGAIINDRKIATVAVESIGSVEISSRGLSNAAEAVGTMSGISFGTAGQLFIRGLGDRYSLTTLNGLPIASPNPDNKLIPLEIFSNSILKNVSVTKVYSAESFADYSGARIDIATKDDPKEGFVSASLSVGGVIGTTFADFYAPDRKGWLLRDRMIDNPPFETSFNISRSKALPDLSGSLSGGKSWDVGGGDRIALVASASLSNSRESIYKGYIANINAQGDYLDYFDYDSYTAGLDLSALFNAAYLFGNGDMIGINVLYSKSSSDNYKLRDGFDAEGNDLMGSNSVSHSYSLWNNQLKGSNSVGKSWLLDWNLSYGMTRSREPDRRQVMYRKGEDGGLSLFKLNRQETMRYFGDLLEQEEMAEIKPKFSFGEKNSLVFGAAFKNKRRDYTSTRFYYNLSGIDPEITDIYNPAFLDPSDPMFGDIKIVKDAQPKNSYDGGQMVAAGFAQIEYYPVEELLIGAGVRYEYSIEQVSYYNDASMQKRSVLQGGDFFPALNLKYAFNNKHAIRAAASRTVTRPSFIEMAPFLYKEAYGSAEIRGNENLRNGYNWNFDLKYEFFTPDNKNMFSVGVYYKLLLSPIERVQHSSGGSLVHSFRNAERGTAAGIEAEFRVEPLKALTLGGNVSLMNTDVTLMAGEGIYTDTERALQGASPYIGNLFVTFAPEFKNKSSLSISVMYGVTGPRIHTVGTYGLGNVMQQPVHIIDAEIQYAITSAWRIGVSLSNLLNTGYRFVQNIPGSGESVMTEYYKLGRGISLGVKYEFK